MSDLRSSPPVEEVDTIALLTVDSLRMDRVHGERNGTSLTPNIDALANDALEFSEGISPGPATPDSVPSMLTGAYPSQLPGFSLPPPGSDPLTLAEHLSESGFSSAAFHQNNLITRRYNFDRGFDTYYDISEETREESGRGWWRLRLRNLIEDTPLIRITRSLQTFLMENFGKSLYKLDEPGDSLTNRALGWMDETDGKRFLWIHYMDTHHPYHAPPEIQRQFGPELSEERILQLSRKARSDGDSLTDEEVSDLEYAYDCSVRFVDEQIGRIIDKLETEGEMENAMVVVTADHGEEFLEHGEFGHRKALWDELICVPLIVRYPGIGHKHVEGQAPVHALVDTIVQGEGLFTMQDSGCEYVVAETRDGRDNVRCCRGTEFKLITAEEDRKVTRTNVDGEPVVDESDVPENVITDLEEKLAETHESLNSGGIDEEALRSDLAALGYLDE